MVVRELVCNYRLCQDPRLTSAERPDKGHRGDRRRAPSVVGTGTDRIEGLERHLYETHKHPICRTAGTGTARILTCSGGFVAWLAAHELFA